MENYVSHYGVEGMKWGVRRYQTRDGKLTPAGRKRLGYDIQSTQSQATIMKRLTKAAIGGGGCWQVL